MKRLDLSMLGLRVHVHHRTGPDLAAQTTGRLDAATMGDGSRPVLVLSNGGTETVIKAEDVFSVRLT
jgi:hypothetical protein